MCLGHMLLVILKGKKLLGWFRTKRKGDKIYVKWKSYRNSFKSWIDQKDIAYMSEHFLKPRSLGANVKVELDLSKYATKFLKNAAVVDTSDFAKKTDLADLKSDVDKLDIDKLKIVPINLSNLKSKVDT